MIKVYDVSDHSGEWVCSGWKRLPQSLKVFAITVSHRSLRDLEWLMG